MNDIPRPAEPDIQRWIGEPSFGRGLNYHRQGYIYSPRLQGRTLKAFCAGSQPAPYRVEVTLDTAGVVSGRCSCPVGGLGRCKHVAALLLTWHHDPAAFEVMEGLEAALERRAKPELIQLIKTMIKRYPDLDVLLELPVAGCPESGRQLDPELIRRQVNTAFSRAGYDWEAASRLAVDLADIVGLGDEYARHGDWVSAGIVFDTAARVTLERFFEVRDEGQLAYIVHRCTQGLAECLEAADDPAGRKELLRSLFGIYRWDADAGGYYIGEEIPGIILAQANAEERPKIAAWIQVALSHDGDSIGDYHRQDYGGLMLSLLEAELDDEAYLQICRQTGRLTDLVDRLLARSRVKDAMAEARGTNDYYLLRLADRFVKGDRPDVAELLVRERAQQSADSRLQAWLMDRAKARGDTEEALAFAEALFWQRPCPLAYEEMRDLALRLGRWDSLRSRCLTHLQHQGRFALLTKLHLLDGEVGQAIDTLELSRSRSRWGTNDLELAVAQAAEKDLPREAIRLYMDTVDQLIAARGRGNYAVAAAHLLRVRALYDKLGEKAAWQSLIAGLREKNRRLPAMQDEFDQAGLLPTFRRS